MTDSTSFLPRSRQLTFVIIQQIGAFLRYHLPYCVQSFKESLNHYSLFIWQADWPELENDFLTSMSCETENWNTPVEYSGCSLSCLGWLFNTHAVSHGAVVLQTVDPNVTENTKMMPELPNSLGKTYGKKHSRVRWTFSNFVVSILASCLRCFEKMEEIVENCSVFSQRISCELNSTANECKETKAAVVKYCSQNECNG